MRARLPWRGPGLSIGVGTGRFAAPLGGQSALIPRAVLDYAGRWGITAIQAVAEALPFAPATFDYALLVTTICFVNDAAERLGEACRVLKPGGELVIGFIDRDSELGRHYLAHQEENVFLPRRYVLQRRRGGGASGQRRLHRADLGADPVTPPGAQPGHRVLGALLSLSAGALVYVGATHLLPQAEHERRKYSLWALAAGVLVAMIIVLSK